MNTNMLVTIDEDSLNDVAGGTCIDPCALIDTALKTVDCLVETGASVVCGVVETKVAFAHKLLGLLGC